MQRKHAHRWLLTVTVLGSVLTLLVAPAVWAAGRDPDSHGDAVSATHSSQPAVNADREDTGAAYSASTDQDDTATTTTTTCTGDPDAHGDDVSALAHTDLDSATDSDAQGDAVSALAQMPTCATSSDTDDTAST